MKSVKKIRRPNLCSLFPLKIWVARKKVEKHRPKVLKNKQSKTKNYDLTVKIKQKMTNHCISKALLLQKELVKHFHSFVPSQ